MNPSVFQDLNAIEERIHGAALVSLFLDFDGTLASLRQDPAAAGLDAPTRQTLLRIAGNDRIVTTIISGRALSDLLIRVGLDGLVYAGNHGLQIYGRELWFVEPRAAARRQELKRLSGRLAAELEEIPGVLVEYRGLTTSVHYRGAAAHDIDTIEDTVRALAAPAEASFVVRPGRMSFDIVPRTGWHKGAAALWINRKIDHGKVLSIYVGDDGTDEDAFRVLPDGVTVKVGDSAMTSARYSLADPSAVHEFLAWLANHVPARANGN